MDTPTQRVASDGDLTYTFDKLDRLVLVTRGTTEELRLAYDGLGRRKLERRRVTRPTGTFTEDVYLEYAGANVIEESVAGSTTILATITHAPGVDAPLVVALGPTRANASTFIVGTNVRGDAVVAANLDTDALVEEAYLDPWGEREVQTASMASACTEGAEASVNGVFVSRPAGGCAQHSAVLQRFGIGGARPACFYEARRPEKSGVRDPSAGVLDEGPPRERRLERAVELRRR